MMSRCTALLLCLFVVSCGSGKKKDSEDFRTTFGYFLETGNSSVSGVLMSITSKKDITLFETQTGATQIDGLGFLVGRIVDPAGSPLGGVVVTAQNDFGLAAGSLFYQSAVTGAFGPGFFATTATGRFIVMNVSPGRVNLKCGTGADGNLYVQAYGGASNFVEITASTPKASPQPTWSGVTQNLGGTGTALPGAPEPSVTYQILGTTGLTGTSDVTTGAFNLGTVNALNTYIMKCTKSAFVDTYTYILTQTADLTSGSGGGNVLIASVTNRDTELVPSGVTLTPGTGIFRGRVLDSAGGFTIQARDGNDAIVGEVWYGNGVNGAPDGTLSVTQPDGIFYIYNLPAGQIFLRATKSNQVATAYVDAFADGITMLYDLVPLTQGAATITVSGALISLQGFAVPDGDITLHGLGVSAKSDSFGEYSLKNVPTRHLFIVRTSK